jgi:replicative DNA helicase
MKRVLPHSTEAEASVLGGILIRNAALADVPDLGSDDFYDNRHRVVFDAIRNLEAQSRPIDVVTLENEIARAGKLDAIGGVAFLGELTLRVPTAENVVAYADIVREKARAREVMLVASEIAERGYDEALDVADYLDEAEAQILAATARRSKADDAKSVGALARRRFRELDDIAAKRQGGDVALTGIPTGIPGLDRKLGGWQRGVVNLLAARPAMGKSATAMASVDAATLAGHGAIVFTLEDSWRAYADRAIARGSGIPAQQLRQGDIGGQEASLVAQAVAQLAKRPRWIVDDRGSLSAQEVARAVRRAKSKMPELALAVVDYVQLLRRTPRLSEHEALDEIMGVLAALAKDEDIAVLALSQLNRKLEDRTDKRPQMADLRGSGGLEEKAKVIVAQYRGAYYGGEPQRDVDYDCWCAAGVPRAACSHRPSQDEWERQVQYLLIKNNQGETGRVFATWIGPTLEIR